jgi:hypothetical protein
MSVGLDLTKAALDSRAGSLAIALRDALRQCSDFCDLLNNTNVIPNDAFLTGMGYTAGEVTTLRAAFTDAKALRNVATAAQTVPSVNDFLFNLKKLMGTSV